MLKNIIFDLDGTLVESNSEAENIIMIKMLNFFYENNINPFKINGHFIDEAAKINYDEYLQRVYEENLFEKFGIGIEKGKYFELLSSLKSKYNLYIYSDSAPIHVNHYLEVINNKNSCFFKAWKGGYSNYSTKSKDNSEVLKTFCLENNLNISETMLIDDSLDNCRKFESFGGKSIWYEEATMGSIYTAVANLL